MRGGGSVLQDPRGRVFFSFIKVYIIITAVYHDLVCTNVSISFDFLYTFNKVKKYQKKLIKKG